MRTSFVLVINGSPSSDLTFKTVDDLAAHIHRQRRRHGLTLGHAMVGRLMPPHGEAVSVHLDEDGRRAFVGYAFFPETRAYIWPANRDALSAALKRQCPDLIGQEAAVLYEFDTEAARRGKGRAA